MERPGPYNEFKIPEIEENLHRPPGSPRPREIKSQQAQLESSHQHGTQKDKKLGMKYKIGAKERED